MSETAANDEKVAGDVKLDEKHSDPFPCHLPPEQEIIKQFTDAYRHRRLLWDSRHKLFNSRYHRHKAVDELANILKKLNPEKSENPKATAHNARVQMNSLRSNYRKGRKKLGGDFKGSIKEAGELYGRKSWMFHTLRSLYKIPQVDKRTHSDNFTNEQESFGTESSQLDLKNSKLSKMRDYKITSHRRPLDKNIINDIEIDEDTLEDTDFDSEIDEDTLEYTDTELDYIEVSKPTTDEEYKMIGRNVELKLKRMSDAQRNQAEWLINKVLSSGLNNLLNVNTDVAKLNQELRNYAPFPKSSSTLLSKATTGIFYYLFGFLIILAILLVLFKVLRV